MGRRYLGATPSDPADLARLADAGSGAVDTVVANGILVDYDPPSGIDNVARIDFDPTAQVWSAGMTVPCPQGDSVGWVTGDIEGSPPDSLWTSPGLVRGAGFAKAVRNTAGTRWFASNLKGLGLSHASVEPSNAGGADNQIRWEVLTDYLSAGWQATHAYSLDQCIIAAGYVWRCSNYSGGTSGGSEPNWASISMGNTITDGSVAWNKWYKAAGAWTAGTSYGVRPTTDHAKLEIDVVTITSDSTVLLLWTGAFGTFATAGGSEPSWDSAATRTYWADGDIVWIKGTDVYGGGPDGGNDRLVLTGLLAPASDGKQVWVTNIGTGLMSVTLADDARIADGFTGATDVDSTSANTFDFGGHDITLLPGQTTLLVYDAAASVWRGNATPASAGGGWIATYRWSDSAVDSDPGSGYIKTANGGAYGSPWRVSLLDLYGEYVAALLDALDDSTSTVKGFLRLFRPDDPTKFSVATVSAVASPSGYKNITVSVVTASSGLPFWPDEIICLAFTPTGDKGTTGSTGTPGSGVSIDYTFSTTTTDSDPGAGKLRLSNATQTAATVIRADLTDVHSVDATAVLDNLDASTGTVKGYIRLVKTTDLTKWIEFTLTSRASPSGYRNLTVVEIAASGASPVFANNDPVTLVFTRTGDKGDTGATGGAPADNTIVAAKMAMSATDKVIGRATAGAGAGEEIALTAAGRALIDDTNAAAQRTTLGLGTAAVAATGDFDASGVAAAAVSTHAGLADPHPGYLTPTEGDAAYRPIGYVPTHAATTGQTADDHHAQAHHAAHEPSGADPMAVDAAAATGSLRTLGTGATQATGGTDARLSDARTPTTHGAGHLPGAADPIGLLVRAAAATVAAGAYTTWLVLADNSSQIANTTPTTVMTISATGTGRFHFKCQLIYQSDTATVGIDVAVNHTGTLTQFLAEHRLAGTGTSASTAAASEAATGATGAIYEAQGQRTKDTIIGAGTVSVDGANLDMMSTIEGFFVASADGDLQIKVALETGTAARVIAMQGSFLELKKLS